MNIIPFKNRTINPLTAVEVYRNLRGDGDHKYSVRQGGRVVGHTCGVVLFNARFLVSKAGRDRVLKELRKNVHARVVGLISHHPSDIAVRPHDCFEISYNPYEAAYFFRKDDLSPIKEAPLVCFTKFGVFAFNFYEISSIL